MNDIKTNLFSLSLNTDAQRRLGATDDQISRLYHYRPEFRALWDDYTLCQLALSHWVDSDAPGAALRQLEYVQTCCDLEREIRKQLKPSMEVIQDAVGCALYGSAPEIFSELRTRHGIRGCDVYLAPLFPLVEIAWLAQPPSFEVQQFISECGRYICRRMARLAGGLDVLSQSHLSVFLATYLEHPVDPPQQRQLSTLALAYLRSHSNIELVRAREKALWRSAYRIACSNSSGRPNARQWQRLRDMGPENMAAYQHLAKTPIPDLVANLERVSRQA